jgi:Pentapeptide repeats (8 copies)
VAEETKAAVAGQGPKPESTKATETAPASKTEAPASPSASSTAVAAAAPRFEAQLKAAESIRETAKWLVAIFGAIAGVLIAGTQLSSLGSIEGEPLRLGLGLGSAFLALFGVTLSVWFLLSVMLPSSATLSDSNDFDERHQEAFRGYATSRGELREKYLDALRNRRDNLEGNWVFPPTVSDLEALNAMRLSKDIGGAVDATVALRAYDNLENRMKSNSRYIIGGGAIAAAAIVIFAWAANPPSEESAPAETTSSSSSGDIQPSGASMVGATLTGADLTAASLEDADLHGADLSGAQLVGAVLTNADLRGVNLDDANLRNANLEGALLTGASVDGALWTNTVCPDGEIAEASTDGCNDHLEVK